MIEVNFSTKVGVCGEFVMVLGGPEKIDGDVALRHEAVPFGGREVGITGCYSCDDVVFPGLDATFSRFLSVTVRGNTLEVNVIFLE